MKLEDNIVVVVSGDRICLRPSLRAARELHRLHGGFVPVIQGVLDDNLNMATDIIGQHQYLTFPEHSIWEAGLANLREPLLRYVLACMGYDGDSDKAAEEGERVSFGEYFDHLFRIGTGWLGWSPETTWEATPAEIIEAYKGRCEMLRAMFGGTDKPKSDIPLDDKFRAAFSTLGTKKVGQADA